jgi:hypothetical protein
MTSSFRRLLLATGLAVAWQLFVVVGVGGLSYLVRDHVDLEWFVKVLLFPLPLLWWLERKVTEAVGVPGPGHLVLPEPWRTAVQVAVPVLQVSFVAFVIYMLLSLKANAARPRLTERA